MIIFMDFKVKMPNLSYIYKLYWVIHTLSYLTLKSINYIYIMKKGLLYTYNSLYKHNMYLTNEEVVEDDEGK